MCVAITAFVFGTLTMWTLKTITNLQTLDFSNIMKQPHNLLTRASETNFTILFYAKPDWSDYKTFNFDNCSYRNCKFTTDTKQLSTSTAVIFHHDSFSTLPVKASGQIWICATLESPYYTRVSFKTDKSKMKFNWTMTYRKDAEGFSPYALLKKQIHIPFKNYTSIFLNKTHNIAWVVSDCQSQSKREAYVNELSKYIDVDIYGK